jgi:HEAT repeat protein
VPAPLGGRDTLGDVRKGSLVRARKSTIGVALLALTAMVVLCVADESSARPVSRNIEILSVPDTPAKRPPEIPEFEWDRGPDKAWVRLRVSASRELTSAGARGVKEMVKTLSSAKDDRVRVSMLSCLSQMTAPGDPDGVKPVPALKQAALELSKLLGDPNPGVQYLTIKALGRARYAAALDKLHALAGDGQMVIRLAVADALGLIGSAKSEDAVLKLMADEDKSVRLHGIKASGELGPALKIVPALIQLLKKDDINERNAAIDALKRLTGYDMKKGGRWLLATTAKKRAPLIAKLEEWWKKTLDGQRFGIIGNKELTLRINILTQRWQKSEIKLAALHVIEKQWNGKVDRTDTVITYLILALRDKDKAVRKEVARVATKLSGIRIIYRDADTEVEWDTKVDEFEQKCKSRR